MADPIQPGPRSDPQGDNEVSFTVVCCAGPREVSEWTGTLPRGATVQQAIEASAASHGSAARDINDAALGVWGRKAQPGQLLYEGDRVEIYRPLRVDPKVARRERFRAQGARATGLFANKRQGAKPGY